MKTNIKRCFALLLAVVMIMAMGVTAVAEETTGSITILEATNGATYTAYKIFDATVGENAVAYTFTKTDNNVSLYNILTGSGSPIALTEAGENDSGNMVYNVAPATPTTEAKDIVNYLKQNQEVVKNAATLTKSAEASNSEAVISGLEYGYYYVTTTTGTLVGVLAADPDAKVNDKQTSPSETKEVVEDGTGNTESSNTADIGDEITFKVTIDAYPGALNYVYHDLMEAGLTFDNSSVVVTSKAADATEATTLTSGTDYTVSIPTTSCGEYTDDQGNNVNCTFDVTFTESYLKKIEERTVITITYTATLNENATVGATDPNTNKGILSYGETGKTSSTPESTTKTYTFSFDVLKYDAAGGTSKTLEGVQFKLFKGTYDSDTKTFGTGKWAIIADGKLTGWSDTKEGGTTLTTDSNGKISIAGLDADTYWLEEVEALKGYNKLEGAIRVTINDGKSDTYTAGSIHVNNALSEGTTVEVANSTGESLPETGGMGTTIFYIVGSVLVIGAVVLIITRRRMNGAKG